MTRRPTDGPKPDDDGIIEEIPLQADHRGSSATRWDVAAVAIFGLALLGGLLIAAGNAFGGGEPQTSGIGRASPSASEATASHREPEATPLVANAWTVTAVEHRDEVGRRFVYECPPGGEGHRITGTGTYTDDSSICSAAVHVGLITFEDGGSVTIQIRPGLAAYAGSHRNGIYSFRLNRPGLGSFLFVGEPKIGWEQNAVSWRGAVGETYPVDCPAGGTAFPIWGTDIYSDDSSVCTAAVHAGLIGFDKGGVVMVHMRVGRNGFASTIRYGVESMARGSWQGSFSLSRPSDPFVRGLF